MAYIKQAEFHIKGTPKADEVFKVTTDNYVTACLGYDKGKGYYWNIHRSGKYTLKCDGFDDAVMCCYCLGDKSPSAYELILPVNRASKKREQEAVAIFDTEVVSVITERLGYDIEEE